MREVVVHQAAHKGHMCRTRFRAGTRAVPLQCPLQLGRWHMGPDLDLDWMVEEDDYSSLSASSFNPLLKGLSWIEGDWVDF
jgi:hypothetical protein